MKILFLCTHNACRSILAQSIANGIAKDLWQAFSAGSHPAGQVHPDTLTQLKRHNYSIDGLSSKSWDTLSELLPDIVITVCDQAAGETCPVWFGHAIKGHWALPDPTKAPAELKEALFKQVIKTCETRLQRLAQALRNKVSGDELRELIQTLAKEDHNGQV